MSHAGPAAPGREPLRCVAVGMHWHPDGCKPCNAPASWRLGRLACTRRWRQRGRGHGWGHFLRSAIVQTPQPLQRGSRKAVAGSAGDGSRAARGSCRSPSRPVTGWTQGGGGHCPATGAKMACSSSSVVPGGTGSTLHAWLRPTYDCLLAGGCHTVCSSMKTLGKKGNHRS
jgi:hypothetical protein